MLSVDLPVSLKVSFRSSPNSRLMPLNEESCAVVVICAMMLLYWATRLARVVCEIGSASGAPAGAPVRGNQGGGVVAPVGMVVAGAGGAAVHGWAGLAVGGGQRVGALLVQG